MLNRVVNGDKNSNGIPYRFSPTQTISIGPAAAQSQKIIPAFNRTKEQRQLLREVLKFLKDFELTIDDLEDLQVFVQKKRSDHKVIEGTCSFQVFDIDGERFCYLFNLKAYPEGKGTGTAIINSVRTLVERDIIDEVGSEESPGSLPQIVHYLASVGDRMPAHGFYLKKGFIEQEPDSELWAHQGTLKLYHLEVRPNANSDHSLFF